MFTIPNILCVARIGMTPFIANLIINSQYVPAIGLVAVAGVTDLVIELVNLNKQCFCIK